MFDFIAYLRWRSLIVYMILAERLVSLIFVIPIYQQIINVALVIIISLIHQYGIYREDKGVTHREIVNQLQNLRATQEQHQVELIELIKQIV